MLNQQKIFCFLIVIGIVWISFPDSKSVSADEFQSMDLYIQIYNVTTVTKLSEEVYIVNDAGEPNYDMPEVYKIIHWQQWRNQTRAARHKITGK